MKTPPNMSEEEVVRLIRLIAKRLAPKFTFGYYDREDLEQEAFIIGMEGLQRFDESKGSLQTFLTIHIYNRLQTFKRDNFYRPDCACPRCNNEDSSCEYCARRHSITSAKRNIMEPLDLSSIQDEREKNMRTSFDFVEHIEMHEIQHLIDTYLDISLRADYLRMLDNVYIPKHRRERVSQAILDILEEHQYDYK